MIPGEVRTLEGEVELNAGRETFDVLVMNTGDRPIQVGSHFHAADVNAALVFEPAAPTGFRFDIPAGTSLRFEPGPQSDPLRAEPRRVPVRLVAFGGARRVPGLQMRAR